LSQQSADPTGFRTPWRVASLALAVGALAVTGCGGSKSTSSAPTSAAPAPTTTTSTSGSPSAAGGAGGALSLSANSEGQLAYDTKSLSAKAGKVTIDFTNNAPLSHDVAVESSAGKSLGGLAPFSGGSKTLTLDLKPGTYKYFCTVPGHRMAGMEGTLVVK
jgi:plastocyanin